ncbi:lysM and putative peptidoglycan-binding domain-containing protein 1 [Pseudophryne corroboree]|uniref:lysM and putative peptidoglycan-binding domain-containing protein 1 n=1 Tax=Pseudophryne corroboree TaxID=495146 RepID=UPI0030820982
MGSDERGPMASPPRTGDSGLLRGTRARSYGSLVQSPYSPARMRKVEHLVQPGDTLPGLSLKYGVTMEQIKRANRLYTNDSIFLKQYLSIPVPVEPPELSNGMYSEEDLGAGDETSADAAAGQPERRHQRCSTAKDARKEEVSVSDFMSKLDTRIRVSKRAAVKKIREVETLSSEECVASGYQINERTGEASPQTQQRSLLGPLPLTVTTRSTALRDHEDEIFKL